MDSRPPQDSLNPAALELLRFRQRLFAATPRLWVTYALVALNCGVWMVQVVAGVDAASPGAEVLVRWGGNLGTAVHAGEYWRLLSATVLHGGAIHLAFNMFALWIIGQTVERVLGNAGFAATYLISGLAGSVASVIASPDVVSVGASGAVFGILGAQLTALLSRRVGLPAALRPGIMRNGVLIIGVNLAFGFSIPNIDNAAHMGGLIAGAMAGAALAHSLDSEGIARRGRRAALATLGGIGILAATLALVPNSAGADRARMPSGRRELDDVHSVYLELVRGLNEQESVRRAAADGIDERVVPRAQKAARSLRVDGVRRDVLRVAEARVALYVAHAELLRSPTRRAEQRFEEARDRLRASESAFRDPGRGR